MIKATVGLAIFAVGGIWAGSIARSVPVNPAANFVANSIAYFGILVLGVYCVVGIYYTNRAEPVKTYLRLIKELESHRDTGLTIEVQRKLNRHLDKLAGAIGSYPQRVRARNLNVRKLARLKAMAILELHEWVSTPLDENTYDCLLARVENDLRTLVTVGWQRLPEPEHKEAGVVAQQSRSIVVQGLLISIAGIIGIGLVMYFNDNLGASTAFLAFVAGLVVVSGLIRAGVPVAQMKELIDLVKSVPTGAK